MIEHFLKFSFVKITELEKKCGVFCKIWLSLKLVEIQCWGTILCSEKMHASGQVSVKLFDHVAEPNGIYVAM